MWGDLLNEYFYWSGKPIHWLLAGVSKENGLFIGFLWSLVLIPGLIIGGIAWWLTGSAWMLLGAPIVLVILISWWFLK